MAEQRKACTLCNSTPAFPVTFKGADGPFTLNMCASDAHEMAPVIRKFWRDTAARAAPPS